MHERFPEQDAAVRSWFDAQGWPVTRINYDFDADSLAWRHEGQPFRTLYIGRAILEDLSAAALREHLDTLGLAEKMQRRPNLFYALARSATGSVLVAERSEPPQ